MNRRQLLKLLASGLVGSTLDVDRLLWIPNTKTIFLPSIIKPRSSLTVSMIMEAELARIYPHIRSLFERDDILYRAITRGGVSIGKSCELKSPLKNT
jgi:hypothetical protein